MKKNSKNFLKLTPNKLIMFLAFLGMLLSAYLWANHLNDKPIPCTITSCEHVLSSEYAEMFGVPMGAYGFFFYAFVAFTAFIRFFVGHKVLDRLLLGLITWGIAFSLYLRYLEFVKIGGICEWCWMSVFIVVLLLFTFLIEKRQKSKINKEK